MPRPSKRDRGRFLTETGLQKLRDGIHAWEQQQGLRCTDEKLGELAQFDATTAGKIRKAKGKADLSSLQSLFQALTLTLEDSDHSANAPVSAPKSDPNFVGREGAIADLDQWVSRGTKIIVIQAKGGVGKTTLARRYLQQRFHRILEFPIAKETKDIGSIEALLEEKLRQLDEEPGREFFVSLDRLKRKLQTEPIGILIDNLEPALDNAGRFIEPHRRYVELLRILDDPSLQSLTLITSRERLRESSITTLHYPLEGLDLLAWQQFFQGRNLKTETSSLAELHRAYGGNAKAMEILCGAIREDFSGDIEAYWQANQDDLLIEQDLKDLVEQQFERLQRLNPEAYQLLCRMGCYRYQDVPRVPIGGLFCLLWDVPEPRHRRVIKTLQDRSLIDFENHDFWLHPIIRAESISRLRETSNWILANQVIANFWIEKIIMITTVEDALTVFESYFHYIEICDFESACGVIIKKKQAQWEWYNLDGGETVFNAFRRLGLSQKTTSSINEIIDKVHNSYSLVLLHLSLAQNYLISGQLHRSIQTSVRALEITKRCLEEAKNFEKGRAETQEYSLNRHLLAILVTQAICYLDLLELENSAQVFEQVIVISHEVNQLNYAIEALFGLAFIYSNTNRKKSQEFVHEASDQIENSSQLLSEWCIGYRFIFLGLTYKNLDLFHEAFEMYQQAISFSQEANYVQIEGKALTGLAELYRLEANFGLAISTHLEAIEILAKLETKCDLAEAYFQLGLTYQAMGEMAQAVEFRDRALQLFREMEAPKQVERVTKAFND